MSQLVTAWWNRSPMKTKLDGIQAGAQVNRAFGSIAGTTCQGNDARLSNAREWNAELVSQMEAETGTTATVRKWSAQRVSQLVTAWWNRSPMKTKLDGIQAGAQVNQAFGSTAGTTCQGNDIRLNNAREWTADLISQAEAAAGSATIARKWSAQRVRQAIDARVPNTDSSINTYALCLHKQEAGLSPVAGQLISAAKLMRCNAAGTAIATTGGTWRLMTPISINSTNPVERVGLFIRVN